MRILVACEESGVLTYALRRRGHEAFSCDVIPTSGLFPEYHLQQDVTPLLNEQWDLVVAFPPCTHLAVSGARHFAEKRRDGRQQEGIDFFLQFTKLSCTWAIENPVGIMSSVYRKPDQIIQPWQFGHPETKATCLWLNGLSRLKETNNVKELMKTLPPGKAHRIHHLPPSADRARQRSQTYTGIADAMAEQWG